MARSLAIILGIGNGGEPLSLPRDSLSKPGLGGTGASSAKVFARAGYDVVRPFLALCKDI